MTETTAELYMAIDTSFIQFDGVQLRLLRGTVVRADHDLMRLAPEFFRPIVPTLWACTACGVRTERPRCEEHRPTPKRGLRARRSGAST